MIVFPQDSSLILKASLECKGFSIEELDGSRIIDKLTFLKETARALVFPAYFGMNWDAFIDSLREFSYCDTSGVAIIWNDVDTLIQRDLQTFVDAITLFDHVFQGMRFVKRWPEGKKRPEAYFVFLMSRNCPQT